MKVYLPIALSSIVSTTALMVLLAIVQPRFFSLVPGVMPPDSLAQLPADSTKLSNANSDSLQLHQHQGIVAPGHSAIDSSSARQKEPPVENPKSQEALHSVEEAIKRPNPAKAAVDSLNEVDKKTTVQILESMDAQSAANILKNMDEYAIRQVISAMKKRQSAKILTILEPELAARLLNGKTKQ